MLSQGADGSDRTPIEFYGRTDPVNTRTQDHDTMIVKGDVVLAGVIRGVEVIGVTGEFGRNGVDLLDEGCHIGFKTESSNGEFVGPEALGDLSVRETELLGMSDHAVRKGGDVIGSAVIPW
jgi:hypothetical protein